MPRPEFEPVTPSAPLTPEEEEALRARTHVATNPYTPLNPDGTPMTPEQIAAAKAASQTNMEQHGGQGAPGSTGNQFGEGVPMQHFDEAGNLLPGGGNINSAPGGPSGILTQSRTTGGLLGGGMPYDIYKPVTVQDTTTGAWQQGLGAALAGAQGRAPLTMQGGTVATGPQDQFRAQQMSLAEQLGAGARGEGPSAAQAMLKLATDRSMNQALSLALAARGGNQAAAMKQAQMQRAMIGQEAGAQSAALAAQEQQQAQQALGQVLSTGRGADIGLASQQAVLDQQTGATNLEAQIQQQAQKDAAIQNLMKMGMTLDEATRQAEIQQRQFQSSLLAQQEAARAGVGIQSAAQGLQLVGAGASGLGSLLTGAMTASDERVKHDVKSGERPLAELLGAVGAHDYEYDEPDEELRGHGRFVSPMAQEIEETQIGKSMVREVDGTKVVDYGKGLGAMLSGLGWLHKRLEQLEGAA